MKTVTELDELFASFDIEELEVLEIADGVALPAMGASSLDLSHHSLEENRDMPASFCCSSSSSCCCC